MSIVQHTFHEDKAFLSVLESISPASAGTLLHYYLTLPPDVSSSSVSQIVPSTQFINIFNSHFLNMLYFINSKAYIFHTYHL